MGTNDKGIGIVIGSKVRRSHTCNHKPNQLDWKQSHTGFNEYEYNVLLPVGTGDPVHGTSLDFPEHLEDPVTRAFTVMDRARPTASRLSLQLAM